MKITREMLDVAVRKAVEAGLLPRHARGEDAATHEELIRFILQAALETAEPEPPFAEHPSRLRRGSSKGFAKPEEPTRHSSCQPP